MSNQHHVYSAALLELVAKADAAARQIPPLFPLSSSVAVNPYLGQVHETLPQTAARLARVSGTPVTPDRAHFAQRIADGTLTDDDLRAACGGADIDVDIAMLKEQANTPRAQAEALPTIADLAAEVSGIDWPGIIDERIGVWAASYFDAGQALWHIQRRGGAFAAWRAFATRDLTPEILGLNKFAAHVDRTSRNAWRALGAAAERLGILPDAADTAFHRLLMDLGGWSQYARYQLWQAELAGDTVTTVTDLLAIRLIWEEALFIQYQDQIEERWTEVLSAHVEPLVPSQDDILDSLLQSAAEGAAQRLLADRFETLAKQPERTNRPAIQAAFCIDVRSEVFRRALESLDPGIDTIGFAGFFGLPVAHKASASDVVEGRGPVLLPAGMMSSVNEPEEDDLAKRYAARAARAWGRFKLAAVSSFAFVEATGPIYAGKLLRDAMGIGKKGKADPAPQFDPNLDTETRLQTAETILKAMSLTDNFARIVMLAGHGADVVNNAHASALQCGACGGFSGEVNARLLTGLLNDPDIRAGLSDRGIAIPSDTLFVPALHHTTTDDVTLYEDDCPSADHAQDLILLRRWLRDAGRLARAERALRLPRAAGEADIARRSTDWAELRAEWGLAGCSAFVAAPRGRTSELDLGGRSFLHSYDWRADEGFGVLELIMTAPVVVASWISLQYYGSSVAPDTFGGGNKLLHNVTGGIGVLEGNGGALRAGLPLQSVHDGERLVHDPLRLTVVIEAPCEAMTDILSRHADVRALFDNGWLSLFAMDDDGRMAWRYTGDLTWTRTTSEAAKMDAIAAE